MGFQPIRFTPEDLYNRGVIDHIICVLDTSTGLLDKAYSENEMEDCGMASFKGGSKNY